MFELTSQFRKVLDISKKGIVVLEPEFEEADDATDHGEFTLVGVRKVDLDVVFTEIWVDPHKDIALVVEEDHVFIDDEVSIVACQSTTGTYNRMGVP